MSNTILHLIYILVQIYKTYIRGWAFINRFDSTVCLCLSQAMARFSMRYVMALFMFNELTWDVIISFVDIDEIKWLTITL